MTIVYVTSRGDEMRLWCARARVSWHRRRIRESGGRVLRVEQ